MTAPGPRLACPHCGKAVSANPIGRWLQRFQCPHCRGVPQFDARTAMGLSYAFRGISKG